MMISIVSTPNLDIDYDDKNNRIRISTFVDCHFKEEYFLDAEALIRSLLIATNKDFG